MTLPFGTLNKMTFAYKITMTFGVDNEFCNCIKVNVQFRRVVRVGCRAKAVRVGNFTTARTKHLVVA